MGESEKNLAKKRKFLDEEKINSSPRKLAVVRFGIKMCPKVSSFCLGVLRGGKGYVISSVGLCYERSVVIGDAPMQARAL